MSDTELNTVFDILGSARSVRKYEDRPIDRAVLTKIVQAGTFASNPRNTQPWKFIVVDNLATKENLASFIEPRALEVEKVIPELVFGDDPKSVAYQNFVAILVEAIKELNQKVDRLTNNQV